MTDKEQQNFTAHIHGELIFDESERVMGLVIGATDTVLQKKPMSPPCHPSGKPVSEEARQCGWCDQCKQSHIVPDGKPVLSGQFCWCPCHKSEECEWVDCPESQLSQNVQSCRKHGHIRAKPQECSQNRCKICFDKLSPCLGCFEELKFEEKEWRKGILDLLYGSIVETEIRPSIFETKTVIDPKKLESLRSQFLT